MVCIFMNLDIDVRNSTKAIEVDSNKYFVHRILVVDYLSINSDIQNLRLDHRNRSILCFAIRKTNRAYLTLGRRHSWLSD